MLACFLTDIFLDVYGECRKRKTAGLELSHFGLKKATSKLLIRIKPNNHYAQIAQLVRASPCHGEGREFESLLGR